MRFHRSAQTERFTCQQTQPYATVTMNREIISFMMRKCGSGFFLTVRKRYTRLDRMNWSSFAPRSLEALRMGDSTAGDHPVHLARPYCLLHTNRVTVHDFTREQISHC